MQGSYVVNERVRGGGGGDGGWSNNSSFVQQSYRRCLCLIATIVVFTVATVVVLLALNSQKVEVDKGVAGSDAVRDGLHMDKAKGEENKKISVPATTTERIMPREEKERRFKQPIHYWRQADSENEIKGSETTVRTTVLFPVKPIVFTERFPVTPRVTNEQKKPLLITTTTTTQREFHELPKEPTVTGPASEADNLEPTRFQEQQRTVKHNDQIHFPGQRRNYFQRLRFDDEFSTTERQEEEHYSEEDVPVHQVNQQRDDQISSPGGTRRNSKQMRGLFTTTSAQTVPTTLRHTTHIHTTPYPPPLRQESECKATCNSLHCFKSLSDTLMRIDFEQDPCEDFYKYACNGLQVNDISPPSVEQRFRKKIEKHIKEGKRQVPFLDNYKVFYESCMVYKCDGTTDPVVKYFRPLLNSVAPGDEVQDKKAHKLTHLIGRILLDGHLSSRVIPLFDIDLEYISPLEPIPVITMPVYPSLLQGAHSDDVYVANCILEAQSYSETEKSAAMIIDVYEKCLGNNGNYIKVLEKAMRIFEIFGRLPEFEREQQLKKILMTIEWEVLDVLLRLSDKEIIQEATDAIVMTVPELNELCPAIQWNVLFPLLFDGQVDQVKVRFNDRLKAICKFYASTDYDVLHDVILSMLAHDWYVEFMRPIQIPDRKSYCERLSNELMQDVASNVFMANSNPFALKSFGNTARELFNQLKKNLLTDIQTVNWISSEEKQRVSLLVDRLDIVDDYASILEQDAMKISNLVLDMTVQDFVSNVLLAKRRNRGLFRNFKNLPQTTVFSHLFKPLSTEVQFIPGKHLVFIPLPLVNMFVDRVTLNDLQKYEVFSRLGYLIGRSLMRPLQLKQLKKQLNSEDNEVLKNFEDYLLTESPIRKFKGANLDLDLGSTNISINSRFADDGSLRLTWETYQKLTLHDLPMVNTDGSIANSYFLGVAQQFCGATKLTHELAIAMYTQTDLPNNLRVNSMMMNSNLFKDTFACPVGSVMNPVVKNHQFPFIDEDNFHTWAD